MLRLAQPPIVSGYQKERGQSCTCSAVERKPTPLTMLAELSET